MGGLTSASIKDNRDLKGCLPSNSRISFSTSCHVRIAQVSKENKDGTQSNQKRLGKKQEPGRGLLHDGLVHSPCYPNPLPSIGEEKMGSTMAFKMMEKKKLETANHPVWDIRDTADARKRGPNSTLTILKK